MIEHMFGIEEQELALTPSVELIDQIRREEQEISRHRAKQVRLLRELLSRYWSTPTPSVTDLATHLDISTDTPAH